RGRGRLPRPLSPGRSLSADLHEYGRRFGGSDSKMGGVTMKRFVIVGVLILACGLLVSPGRPAGGAAPGLKIGVASATITPFLDVPLEGYYYPRMPDGVHDDLHAKALVIDDGHEQA